MKRSALRVTARPVLGLALVAALIALFGGTTGRASTAVGPALTGFDRPLGVDPAPAPNVTPTTPGGNIAYSLNVTNNGTSTANHLGLTDTIGAGGSVAYFADDIGGTPAHGCTGVGTENLTCAIPQLAAFSVYHVLVVFRTPATATQVTNSGQLSFDSQTNGTSNRKTVPFGGSATTLAPSNGSTVSSYALGSETLGPIVGGETGAILMPPGFLNGHAGVQSTVRNNSGTPPFLLASCSSKCPGFWTEITIPDADSFLPESPFFSDSSHTSAPFQWTLTLPGALVPSGFKLTGVYHNGALLPACDSRVPPSILGTGTPPNVVTNCVASLVQVPNTKKITATGWGIANGSYQFG